MPTSKEFYQKMHGFDTVKGEQFRGHMKWGHLEPMLSLKAEMYGDGCRLYPDIEVGHVFGRKTEGARSAEYQYWNALWIAHTMLDKDLRDELLDFIKPNFQYGIAQQWVKQHRRAGQSHRHRAFDLRPQRPALETRHCADRQSAKWPAVV